MNNRKVKLVLQGRGESFEEYENRLNKELKGMVDNDKTIVVVIPSAAADGRLCCCINYF